MAQQRVINDNLGYNGNPNIKRDGITQTWTQEDVAEYLKCMHNPAYFAAKYIKVINLNEGLVPFELYPYQENMFEQFSKNRFSIVLSCRQSGKSITSIVWILHYAIFNPEKTIAILANKGATAREMLSRITLALENLPFFLQPGCKVLNKGSIVFSNNSRIIASATSASSVRGFSIDVVFLDEFAFVENAEVFYTSTYPVISSGKNSKVIITSTANGVGNLYHKLWEGAVQGTNEFTPIRVDWWDVPGRDEEWKRQTIANTSDLQFRQEFSNQFIGTGNTLIEPDTLLGLKALPPVHEQDQVKVYKKTEEGHSYLMFVDVSKGRGQDYSTFNIIDVSVQPFEQVAVYRNNNISPLLFPDVIYKYAVAYNNAYVIIENNDTGQVVCNALYYDIEYEFVFVESTIKTGGIGVTTTKKIKRIGCSNIKDIIERGQLVVVDKDTIIELSTFEAKGQSYEATPGNHDDLVMNLVLFGWFVTDPMFAEFTSDDLKRLMYEQQIKEIEDDVIPFGFVDDGQGPEIVVESDGTEWHEVVSGTFH